MLIKLDESLDSQLGNLDDAEWDALNHLASAAREGSHLLLASINFADRLSTHPNIGVRQKGVYRAIYARYPTIATAVPLAKTSVRVNRDHVTSELTAGGRRELVIPLREFATTRSVQPSVLLAENLVDIELLVCMARIHAQNCKGQSFLTCVEPCLGGGVTTAQVLEEYLKRGSRLILVVVDSDKKTPNSSMGETARAALGKFRAKGTTWSNLLVTQARELENLVPDGFYLAEFGNSNDHRNTVRFMTALKGGNTFRDARLFVDIKEGLKLVELLHCASPPNDFAAVWSCLVPDVEAERLPSSPSCIDCARVSACAAPAACQCTLMSANGSSILHRASIELSRFGLKWYREMPQQFRIAFDHVAKEVYDWGLSSKVYAS